MLKNIVFDMGGVLIDLNRNACIEAFRQLGFSDVDKYIGEFVQSDVFLKLEEGKISENGFYAEIEKPSIKKNFCFGYSLSSYDTESFDNAGRMAEHARTSADYFREKNLAGLKEKVEYYKDEKKRALFSQPLHQSEKRCNERN
jgi:phosphoglycolate phosphatase-like HAD superfamily hydrolase